jgi:hypothetical protein
MKIPKNHKIESDEDSSLTINKQKYNQKKQTISNFKIYVFVILIILFIILAIVCCYLIRKQKYRSNIILSKNFNINIEPSYKLIESYINAQKDFCENPNIYINEKYESNIFLSDVKLNDYKFQMYIFKSDNFILNEFKLYGAYEIPLSNYIIEALNFYSSKYIK